MKRLLLIAVLVLGVVVAGVFFVDTTPRVPLAVGIVKVQEASAGSVTVVIRVTNLTDRLYDFDTDLVPVSNTVTHANGGSRLRSFPWDVDAHGTEDLFVGADPTKGSVRVLIRYRRGLTPARSKINEFLRRHGLPTLTGDGRGKVIVSDPVPLRSP